MRSIFNLLIVLSIVFHSQTVFGQFEMWTDKSGEKSVKAVFLGFRGGKVWLGRQDGKTVSVALSNLSVESRNHAEDLSAKAIKAKREYESGVSSWLTAPDVAKSHFLKGAKLRDPNCMLRLGIAYVRERQYMDAAKAFQQAATIYESRKLFSATAKYNLLAARNNAAIARIRTVQAKAGIQDFRKCSGILDNVPPELNHNIAMLQHLYEDNPRLRGEAQSIANQLSDHNHGAIFDASLGWIFMHEAQAIAEEPVGSSGDLQVNVPLANKDESGLVPFASGTGIVVAPGIVVTAKQVLQLPQGENCPTFHVHSFENLNSQRDLPFVTSEILAQHPQYDLAILRVPELNAVPVRLASYLPAIDSEVFVLGYRQTKESVSTPTASRGHLKSPMARQFANFYSIDARTNSGKNGGPTIDEKGEVVGVLSTTKVAQYAEIEGLVLNDSDAVSIPSAEIVKFVDQHNLRKTIPEPAENDSDEQKDKADTLSSVKLGTVLIISMVKPTQIPPTPANNTFATSDTTIWNGTMDGTCMICHGDKIVDCPNENCSGGQIRTKVAELIRVQGGQALQQGVRADRCPTCQGMATVKCSQCNGTGVDKRFPGFGKNTNREKR